MRHVLVTGGAGFIGSHLVDRLLADGCWVTAIDNFDGFYPREVKERNVQWQQGHPSYRLVEADIRDLPALQSALCDDYDCIVHLAAKAGVRPSITAPAVYQDVNVGGTQGMLEFARIRGVQQFIFASSSSVYGTNPNVPWRENDPVLLPISPYAATKVAGELLGHVYSHLYGIRFIALRLFTVYGPRQRPDLAIHKFARHLAESKRIPLFGDGSSRRDYTFVNDIVDGICAAIDYTDTSYEIVNLGNSRPVRLSELIRAMEAAFETKALVEFHPEQQCDLPQTFACAAKAECLFSFRARTSLSVGLRIFAKWYRESFEQVAMTGR